MAMVLLHQINPREPADSAENQKAQKHHAHQVCGIVAQNKDRGVASVAIRSLAISAGVLRDPREQDEVMAILAKINQETGWRLGKVQEELWKAWRRAKTPDGTSAVPPPPPPPPPRPVVSAAADSVSPSAISLPSSSSAPLLTMQPPPPPPPPPPSVGMQQQFLSTAGAMGLPSSAMGPPQMPVSMAPPPMTMAPQPALVHPLLVQADFSLPNHPYPNWYEPPNRTNASNNLHGFSWVV